MKSKLRYCKLLSWFLAVLLTFQSCIAYEKSSISITDAARSGKKMLVINNANKRMPFKRIEKTDSLYYGIKKPFGKEIRVPLHQNEIKKIRSEDSHRSTLGTVGLVLLGVTAIVLTVTLIQMQNQVNDMFGD